MILYVLISTSSALDSSIAWLVGLTLNPIIIALDAEANITSFSFIPPTPLCITFTFTSSILNFSKDCFTASIDPLTSALITIFKSLTSPSLICSNKSSKETLPFLLFSSSLIFSFLIDAKFFANFSSSTEYNTSPASGTSDNPVISTGYDGPAWFILSPLCPTIVLILPYAAPTRTKSPLCKVPFFNNTVETGPLPLSSLASIITPTASLSSFALISCISATNKIISNNSFMPCFFNADTSTHIVSPPHSSGTNPCSVSSCFTLSGLALSLSILLIATIIGTSAALAWFIASSV